VPAANVEVPAKLGDALNTVEPLPLRVPDPSYLTDHEVTSVPVKAIQVYLAAPAVAIVLGKVFRPDDWTVIKPDVPLFSIRNVLPKDNVVTSGSTTVCVKVPVNT
jgi:hypothetical protein